jgi:hypothetical protein
MDDTFVEKLEATGLGVRGRGNDLLWVGMHPRLAIVYMTALAAQTAEDGKLYPMTGNDTDHVAMGGWSMERLTLGLLADEVPLPHNPVEEEEIETQLASIAIESVVPVMGDDVDVGKIIAFRITRQAELAVFQDWIHSFVPPLLEELGDMKSRQALEAHLSAVVAKDVAQKIKALRNQLEMVGFKTARSAMNIKVTAPKLLATAAAGLGFTLNPIAGVSAGLAVGLFDVAVKARDNADAIVAESPAAYLMHMEEDLRPDTLLGRIRNKVRRFTIGQ